MMKLLIKNGSLVCADGDESRAGGGGPMASGGGPGAAGGNAGDSAGRDAGQAAAHGGSGYAGDGGAGGIRKADILIEDGRIVAIGPNLDAAGEGGRAGRQAGAAGAMDAIGAAGIAGAMGATGAASAARTAGASDAADVIDAEGMFVLPGLIDAHCHLRDPGFEYKEDIETGTAAAAAGGFTGIACMPNTSPVADSEQTIRYIVGKAAARGHVSVYPIGAITKGLNGQELSEMGELKLAGAVAVSDDGRPVASASLMQKALMYAKMFDLPVISHCECLELSDGGDMNEGYVSMVLGLRGIPSTAESVQVAREVLLSEYTGAPVHIAHVSTAQSISVIRDAKRRGVRVTCETCPHYFSLTDEACLGYDTSAKVSPPLATRADVEAVREALRDGTIDIIATDHAPHSVDEKRVEFSRAANGLIGFETAFGLAYTNLVMTGALTLPQLARKMSLNPARLLKIDGGGRVAVGGRADLTIVDTRTAYAVAPERFLSKSRNTPFAGFELRGAVAHTIVGGRPVARHGELTGL
jgi:dihydroorotase